MSELANRKAMLRQKIESDRQLIELEVEGARQRWDSTRRMLRMGVDLAKPVGAVAALAATSVGRAGKVAGKAAGKAAAGSKVARAGAGGLVGLAALIPVAITVAKAVSSMREDKERGKTAGDREAGDDPAAADEATGDATAS